MGNPEVFFPTRWMGHVRMCCMSFPVDILGKAFSGSFRFSRNDANCKDHIEQSLNHWGHPSGSISGAIADARHSFYFVLQLEEKNSYDPRVWMGVKQNFKADRQATTLRHWHLHLLLLPTSSENKWVVPTGTQLSSGVSLRIKRIFQKSEN